MTPITVPLSNIAGAIAGARATIELPQTYRYKNVVLKFTNTQTNATTLADVVGTITLKINGTPQRQREAYQINRLNMLFTASHPPLTGIATLGDAISPPAEAVAWTFTSGGLLSGYVGADGYFKNLAGKNVTTTLAANSEIHLPIFFDEPYRKSSLAGDAMSLPTFDSKGNRLFGSVTLEINLASKAGAANAVTATAEVDYVPLELSNPASPNQLLLSKWGVYTFQAPASNNEVTINQLPRLPGQLYQGLYLFTEGALYGGALAMTTSTNPAIISSKLRYNSNLLFDGFTNAENDARNLRAGMNLGATVPTSYELVLDNDDRVNSALAVGNAQEWVFTPKFGTVGTAGTAQLAYDLYGPLF